MSSVPLVILYIFFRYCTVQHSQKFFRQAQNKPKIERFSACIMKLYVIFKDKFLLYFDDLVQL